MHWNMGPVSRNEELNTFPLPRSCLLRGCTIYLKGELRQHFPPFTIRPSHFLPFDFIFLQVLLPKYAVYPPRVGNGYKHRIRKPHL